jgi:KaiC/GvpD/RAD55 family RecA-like ATPase
MSGFPALLSEPLSPGESLLVSGPPMTGKYTVMLRLLAATADDLVVVSTDTQAATVRRDVHELAGLPPESVGVVDCAGTADDEGGDDLVRHVGSPENLTQLGIQFTSLTEQFEDREHVAVGLSSLSTLLMYWDAQRVYQFLRVFLDRVEDLSWSCVSVVGSTMHDEQTLHTLYDPFDAIIETRETDDGRELRRRGRLDAPTDWEAF